MKFRDCAEQKPLQSVGCLLLGFNWWKELIIQWSGALDLKSVICLKSQSFHQIPKGKKLKQKSLTEKRVRDTELKREVER